MSDVIIRSNKNKSKPIDRELAVETFEYKEGKLFWKKTNRKAIIGSEAGYFNKTGRNQIYFNGKSHLRYRIIWVIFNGEIPDGLQIDHIDGDGSNDKIENLRLATNKQNNLNKFKYSSNSSGFTGVSWSKLARKWRSYIVVDGRQIHLGLFDKKEDAYLAYQKAAYNYHGSFNPHSLNQDSGNDLCKDLE